MTTVLDEVALERAARGDRGVWRALTQPERDTAMIAARARRLSELAENDEWSQVFRRLKISPGGSPVRRNRGPSPLPNSHSCPQWLLDIAEAAGYKTAETFMRAALRTARAYGQA